MNKSGKKDIMNQGDLLQKILGTGLDPKQEERMLFNNLLQVDNVIHIESDYYSYVYKSLKSHSHKYSFNYSDVMERFKKHVNEVFDFVDLTGENLTDIQEETSNFIRLISWPIFNVKNFQNKTFKDFDININEMYTSLKDNYIKNIQFGEYDTPGRKLVDFKFSKRNKLLYVIYETHGGILQYVKKGKIIKLRFIDGSEMKVDVK